MAVGRLQRVIPGGFPQCPTSVAPTAIVSPQLPPAATHWGGPQHLYPTGLKPPFEGAGGGPGSIQGWPMPCTGCPEMAAASVMPLPSQASTPPPGHFVKKSHIQKHKRTYFALFQDKAGAAASRKHPGVPVAWEAFQADSHFQEKGDVSKPQGSTRRWHRAALSDGPRAISWGRSLAPSAAEKLLSGRPRPLTPGPPRSPSPAESRRPPLPPRGSRSRVWPQPPRRPRPLAAKGGRRSAGLRRQGRARPGRGPAGSAASGPPRPSGVSNGGAGPRPGPSPATA